jgi:hypothetical protein
MRAKDLLVQISIQLFLRSYYESYGEFSEPCFPHHFTKNDRHDLNMGLSMRLDVSYNLCSKLGSKLFFFWWTKLWQFKFYPAIFRFWLHLPSDFSINGTR